MNINKMAHIIVSIALLLLAGPLCAYPRADPLPSQSGYFSIHPLSDETKKIMIDKKIWNTNCPITLERLKQVQFSYYDFNGQEHHTGQIVVLDVVAWHVASIFKQLHHIQFPIHKAHPMDEYDGNDIRSMNDNNSSCFCAREITAKGLISIHSYGLAIDINPIQNPYLQFEAASGKCVLLPVSGNEYLNRTKQRKGMVEPILSVFSQHGFKTWGGHWNTPIDWQHFQPSRAMAQLLAVMSYTDGTLFFERYINDAKLLDSLSENDNNIIILYKKNPKKFMDTFAKQPELFDLEPQNVYPILLKKLMHHSSY